jgi:hypothetical protein
MNRDIVFRAGFERLVLTGLSQEWESAVRHMPLEYGSRMRRPAFEIQDFEFRWGEWDARRRLIRLSWRLISEYPWIAVRDVFRHEMAHQMADELLGARGEPHGELFRKACGVLNADPRASHDYVSMQDVLLREDAPDEDRVLSRVRKLLALGQSPHRQEAEAAMAKARELIARHNLDLQAEGKPLSYCSLSLGEPKVRHSTADYSLGQLLRDFYLVETLWISAWVLRSARMGKILEVSGTRENVLMASYVRDFLHRTMEEQWNVEGAAHGYSVRRRNDFALGLFAGFRERLVAKDVELVRENDGIRALVTHRDASLTQYFRQRYPHVRMIGGRGGYIDPEAHETGKAVGRNTVITKPIDRNAPTSPRFLPAGVTSVRR